MSYIKVILLLKNFIQIRLKKEFKGIDEEFSEIELNVSDNSNFFQFIMNNKLAQPEIVAFILALIPHILLNIFHLIISEYLPHGGDLPEVGGTKGKNRSSIHPTRVTVLYILEGKDIEKRIEVSKLFY